MALDVEEKDNDDSANEESHGGMGNGHRDKASHEDEEDGEEEEEEPRLKYASLTKSQAPVYRNGDATSAFMVAGDKMVRC